MHLGVICVIAVVLVLSMATVSGGQVKVEKVRYFNQPNCFKLTNGNVDVIVTTDIGPRVIAYRFVGGENILGELSKDTVVKTEFGEWHPWGGHRLWHAPEVMPRTYSPDDSPVDYEIVGNDSIRLTQSVEPATHIQKEMVVKLESTGTAVTVTQRLTNKGQWPVELAPWGLTIMNGGGVTIFPNEPYIPHSERLLPARPMVLWHYTDMSDPRWHFGKKYVRLHTDDKLTEPQKVGVANKQGWAAYLRNGVLFVTRFPYIEGATYPDHGCNFETYTAGNFMEIETLGPMVKLEPGQSTTHIETWHLFKDVKAENTDASIELVVQPLVDRTK